MKFYAQTMPWSFMWAEGCCHRWLTHVRWWMWCHCITLALAIKSSSTHMLSLMVRFVCILHGDLWLLYYTQIWILCFCVCVCVCGSCTWICSWIIIQVCTGVWVRQWVWTNLGMNVYVLEYVCFYLWYWQLILGGRFLAGWGWNGSGTVVTLYIDSLDKLRCERVCAWICVFLPLILTTNFMWQVFSGMGMEWQRNCGDFVFLQLVHDTGY